MSVGRARQAGDAHEGQRSDQSFEDRVLGVVASLQSGDLVSYGDVAREAGRPGSARAVGQVMARSDGLAWWRVIHADGRLPAGKEDAAAERLRAEGHEVAGSRVRPAG